MSIERLRLVALSVLLLVLVGVGIVQLAQRGDDDEPADTTVPVACAAPPFSPVRLPWREQVGPPTEKFVDGGALVQTWRDPGGSDTTLSVIRGSAIDVDDDSPVGTIRGHAVTATFIGDPGVSELRVQWSEGPALCDQYAASVLGATTADEVVTLFEP
jgi:hypothetical protein